MLILSISVTFNVTCLIVTSFNYEIMPATLANTFLFIVQGSALAGLRYGGSFLGYTWSQLISLCNGKGIIKIGQYLPKLCSK